MNTQVVLITGGLTGIGRATALAFANEGAQVIVSGRRDEEGQKVVSEIRKAGAEAEFIRADVRREEDVRNLVDKTVERFGRLDVAVNTAGTEGVPGPITEQTADSYAATFDTNVLGTLLSMKHELRVMLPQKNGSIVNISSTFGHTGAPGGQLPRRLERDEAPRRCRRRRARHPAVGGVRENRSGALTKPLRVGDSKHFLTMSPNEQEAFMNEVKPRNPRLTYEEAGSFA
jgi:NAD(P)-dependent dehydrogenase (short-subunit alcohol dehydrogenase family)